MTQAAPNLQMIDTAELPVYPIPKTERLESHSYVEFHFNRWLQSRFRLLATPDVRAAGMDLFFLAQNEAPVGTLPIDDKMLAKMLLMDLTTWMDLKSRAISPLFKWEPCSCDGEIRLHHPTVTEFAVKALGTKIKNLEDREKGRQRKRLVALKTQIVAAGGHSSMAENEALIEELDACLVENFSGRNRTPSVVREALEMVSIRS